MNTFLRQTLWGFGILLLPLAGGMEAAAQEWRDLSSTRRVAGEERVDVRVKYGAGRIVVEPGSGDALYRMRLKYDGEIFQPLNQFSDGRALLGVETVEGRISMRRQGSGGEMDLALGTTVPTALVLEFGAVRADLELGGVPLESLELKTGASESRLDVSQANPLVMNHARLEVGAASFVARNLGQLNARNLQVEAGVGDLKLGFGPLLQAESRASVRMGLGSVELSFTRDSGVRIIRNTLLTAFDSEGLVKEGNQYTSPNWASAQRRITVELDAAFGSVSVVWDRP